MRVLLNCSSIVVGGGVQVAVELIKQLTSGEGQRHDFFCCVSPAVAEALKSRRIIPKYSEIIGASPARSPCSRARLLELEDSWKPDGVFTVFGPAYVRFKVPHLMGIADGWVTHSNYLAFTSLSSLRNRCLLAAQCVYKGLWYRKATRWVVEAEVARLGFSKRFWIDREKIFVVSNCCGSHYFGIEANPASEILAFDTVRVLVFAAGYPHKNLDLIPEVALQLKKLIPEKRFHFVLTLPDDNEIWKRIRKLAVENDTNSSIINVGPIGLDAGPALYDSCGIVFLPTLLETFSAVYPEAMAMGRPIITSDLPFARAICADAAAYFQPKNANSAAQMIASLVRDTNATNRLVALGRERLSHFVTPQQRGQHIVALLEQLVGESDSRGAICAE